MGVVGFNSLPNLIFFSDPPPIFQIGFFVFVFLISFFLYPLKMISWPLIKKKKIIRKKQTIRPTCFRVCVTLLVFFFLKKKIIFFFEEVVRASFFSFLFCRLRVVFLLSFSRVYPCTYYDSPFFLFCFIAHRVCLFCLPLSIKSRPQLGIIESLPPSCERRFNRLPASLSKVDRVWDLNKQNLKNKKEKDIFRVLNNRKIDWIDRLIFFFWVLFTFQVSHLLRLSPIRFVLYLNSITIYCVLFHTHMQKRELITSMGAATVSHKLRPSLFNVHWNTNENKQKCVNND